MASNTINRKAQVSKEKIDGRKKPRDMLGGPYQGGRSRAGRCSFLAVQKAVEGRADGELRMLAESTFSAARRFDLD